MDIKKAQELLEKHRARTLTPGEKLWLDRWYLEVEAGQPETEPSADLIDKQKAVFARINESIRPRTIRLWPRIAAAASILLVCCAGGYLLLHKDTPVQTAAVIKHDVDPGGTKAILTLSNGQKIVLNNQQGTIASQGKTNITLSRQGNLNYQANENTTEELYNTLTVPIGNHRDLTLADGTEVSLDAGSSITYPVAFTKADRKVTITGQAYFKVKHDAAHPFFVKVKDLTIQDIGTEFNINAYDDEGNIKTTLVEGSVKVEGTIIKPGQQAIASNNNIEVKNTDIEAVTAWKNNDFLMRDQDLKTTMRQIARWYNVKIVYDEVPAGFQVYVNVSRNRKLSAILAAVARAGKVKFSIDGQTVTVSKPSK